MAPRGFAELRIEYYDDRPADVVAVGQSELIDVERYCRAQGVPQESIEATTYAAWRAALRAGVTTEQDFDAWRRQVASTVPVEEPPGESPTPPA